MNTANPSDADSVVRAARRKHTRRAFAWGFVCVWIAAAFTFYVIQAIGLSRRLGGFEGMEAARPTGYLGIRWFIVICALCSVIIVCSALQFFRACKAARYENKG